MCIANPCRSFPPCRPGAGRGRRDPTPPRVLPAEAEVRAGRARRQVLCARVRAAAAAVLHQVSAESCVSVRGTERLWTRSYVPGDSTNSSWWGTGGGPPPSAARRPPSVPTGTRGLMTMVGGRCRGAGSAGGGTPCDL